MPQETSKKDLEQGSRVLAIELSERTGQLKQLVSSWQNAVSWLCVRPCVLVLHLKELLDCEGQLEQLVRRPQQQCGHM